MGGTVRLHRVLRAPAERIYRAFLDGDALCKWLPPHGFTARLHALDAQVGGGFRMSFTNFGAGGSHSFGGTYLELEPGRVIRYKDHFDDPALAGDMTVRIELTEDGGVTEVRVEQSDIPDPIPLTACYLGWQESLGQLAQLVEPDIPAGA